MFRRWLEIANIVGKSAKLNKKRKDNTVKIDKAVEFTKINPSTERTYICTCCGKEYRTQRNNFYPSKSPLFARNDGYVYICKRCAESYYTTLVDFFAGNEDRAIEQMCTLFDWFYDETAVAATRGKEKDKARISIYPSKINMTQCSNRGHTYIDYLRIKHTSKVGAETQEELAEMSKIDGVNVSNRAIKFWGLGYKPDEYNLLDSHYKMLKEQALPDDIVGEKLIRDLCEIQVQQKRSLIAQEVDKYSKLTELYQKTLNSANLKAKNAKDINATLQADAWSVYIREIEKYTPAEYFKDKAVYEDHDGIGSYFERFIARPFRNLICGTKDVDAEYSVTAEQTADDNDGIS